MPTSNDGLALILDFSPRFFKARLPGVFARCVRLVERAVVYLGGEGRRECNKMSSEARLAYVMEANRVTTHLLNLASWCLIQRSFAEGEITTKEQCAKLVGVKIEPPKRNPRHLARLPAELQAIIKESEEVARFIVVLAVSQDPNLYGKP